MSPQAILSAIPWVKRVLKVTPSALHAPLLLVGAVAGVWFAIQGLRELRELKAAEGDAAEG